MSKNLVIVESPAKAKTIESYLGKDFKVMSSYGHIRDLPNKELGVDIENNFEPSYVVSADKTKVISELKKAAKGAEVWLATDDDREGEAISWHLKEALKLADDTKRIVFREITKKAVTNAIQNPRTIDIDLVNAQQARRILDRLVGFQVSPVLWSKIRISGKDRKNLSAGRVQSVAVRIIVEREREADSFKVTSSYKIVALFVVGKGKILKAELPKNFKTEAEAKAFVEKCVGAFFSIQNLETKPAKKSPAAPFTTSTLQQEASRKLSFSVAQTMSVAQKLYEAGRITYMRTDSTNLSDDAVESATGQIGKEYGVEYIKVRKYKTKSEGAQEAHEAIRPTDFSVTSATGDRNERRLYELIWKRAIASQMADAQLERTTATIDISTTSELLVAKGEVIKFEGFLKVYLESSDDEDEEASGMLPPLSIGQRLALDKLTATERFSKPSARYTEASLVKKMEEMGIGRPSTYAPTISTIIKRTYVVKEDRPGSSRDYIEYVLQEDKVSEVKGNENFGSEKSKLFPTNLGIIVNDFLVENFEDIINFQFTAKVEGEFDQVAEGKVGWRTMIDDFYKGLAPRIKEVTESEDDKRFNATELGTDPESGKPVFAKLGKFGPYVQVGEATDEDKPTFVSLPKGTLLENVSFDYAMELLAKPKLPLEVGIFEDQAVVVNSGRYGPYVLHNGKYYNMDKDGDPYDYDTLEKAVAFIEQQRLEGVGKLPRDMEEYDGEPVIIGKGRYGPYIKHGAKYYNLDKKEDPMEVTMPQVIEMIKAGKEKEANKYIKEFEEDDSIKVLNGRYGPYIKVGKRNVKIPKDVEPKELTLEMCKELASK
jgi:DNA topoisomerase-1